MVKLKIFSTVTFFASFTSKPICTSLRTDFARVFVVSLAVLVWHTTSVLPFNPNRKRSVRVLTPRSSA